MKTLEGAEEYLRTLYGVNGASLSYVVRKQLVPMAEADNPANGYNTIDEDMDPIVVAGIVGTTADLEVN